MKIPPTPLLLASFVFLGEISAAFPANGTPVANPSAAKPKYAATATVLSRSHEYLQSHPAPDFWALLPYYVPQRDGRACSLATITTIVNGARAAKTLGSEEKLATQDEVYARTPNKAFKHGVGAFGRGVMLDDLGPAVAETLKVYGVANPIAEVVHAENGSAEMQARLHRALVENEKSADDFILVNFDQGVFTGDTSAGHISPVAAYDEAGKRVLILDVDREWYEPYWVSEETLLKGMATLDKEAGKNRGFVWVKFATGR